MRVPTLVVALCVVLPLAGFQCATPLDRCVHITSPAEGTATKGELITIDVEACGGLDLDRIELWDGPNRMGTGGHSEFSYSYAWDTTAVVRKTHKLQAYAFEMNGTLWPSEIVKIELESRSEPPATDTPVPPVPTAVEYTANPFVIKLSQPAIRDRGGIIVHDVNHDGLQDYLLSTKEHPVEREDTFATIAAYDHWGAELWLVEDSSIRINSTSENDGLPGLDGPGFSVGDVDGDGQAEVVHIDTTSRVVIRDGSTGRVERYLEVPLPHNAWRWGGHPQIVNLRGLGDRDIILQSDPIPFNHLAAVAADTGEVLWRVNDYHGCDHSGFRAADIDGDGLDEVAGATIIDHDGTRMNAWSYRPIDGHFDSLFIHDVKPEVPGLEMLLLEESWVDDRTAVFNTDQVFFYGSRWGDEPQNAAVGDFDPSRPGLEIWNRSRFDTDQRPWVFDSNGNLIAEWTMNEKKPGHWSTKGVEVIYAIDWDGSGRHLAAAKERAVRTKSAIFDPMTGDFLHVWEGQAARIYVADVAGDGREEVMIVNSEAREIRVHWNDQPSVEPRPAQQLWQSNAYKRAKQSHNYYSP